MDRPQLLCPPSDPRVRVQPPHVEHVQEMAWHGTKDLNTVMSTIKHTNLEKPLPSGFGSDQLPPSLQPRPAMQAGIQLNMYMSGHALSEHAPLHLILARCLLVLTGRCRHLPIPSCARPRPPSATYKSGPPDFDLGQFRRRGCK